MEDSIHFDSVRTPVQDDAEDAQGVLTTKNGLRAMQYKKSEDDVLDEELAKLLESAFACIECNLEDYPKESDPISKQKVLLVIEMLEKLKKIKKLMADCGKSSQDMTDFKCYIKTNKTLKHKTKGLDHHITQFGVHCLNPSYAFKQLLNDPNERPRSVILTSNTLSPMRIMYSELKTQFKIKLINE